MIYNFAIAGTSRRNSGHNHRSPPRSALQLGENPRNDASQRETQGLERVRQATPRANSRAHRCFLAPPFVSTQWDELRRLSCRAGFGFGLLWHRTGSNPQTRGTGNIHVGWWEGFCTYAAARTTYSDVRDFQRLPVYIEGKRTEQSFVLPV